jgi:ADP-ribosyl-[dinitrogen reductase] hydrolase
MTTFFATRYTLLVIFISDFVHSAGALIGLAIGDALGAPLEGSPPPARPLTDMVPGGRFKRLSGEITDDTLQALAIADSLAEFRGFFPYDILRRFINDYRRNPYMYGPTSSAVFERILKGQDPQSASHDVYLAAGSRSNGSVMRGPPLGIFYSGPELEVYSIVCSRLTHYNPVAGACSAWINRMVSDLCRGRLPEEALKRAEARCTEMSVCTHLGSYNRHDPVPGLDALEATHAALYCFMNSGSFYEAVVAAVNMGGDSDTVGAIAGSLAGAYYGLNSIPAVWMAGLRPLPRLMDTAVRLWEASLQ